MHPQRIQRASCIHDVFSVLMLGIFTSLAGSAFCSEASEPVVRTWTDHTGRFTKSATFREFVDPNVTLTLNDGKIITVPIEKLSNSDQEYVRTFAVKTKPHTQLSSRELRLSAGKLLQDIVTGQKNTQKLVVAVPKSFRVSRDELSYQLLTSLNKEIFEKVKNGGEFDSAKKFTIVDVLETEPLDRQPLPDIFLKLSKSLLSSTSQPRNSNVRRQADRQLSDHTVAFDYELLQKNSDGTAMVLLKKGSVVESASPMISISGVTVLRVEVTNTKPSGQRMQALANGINRVLVENGMVVRMH